MSQQAEEVSPAAKNKPRTLKTTDFDSLLKAVRAVKIKEKAEEKARKDAAKAAKQAQKQVKKEAMAAKQAQKEAKKAAQQAKKMAKKPKKRSNRRESTSSSDGASVVNCVVCDDPMDDELTPNNSILCHDCKTPAHLGCANSQSVFVCKHCNSELSNEDFTDNEDLND